MNPINIDGWNRTYKAPEGQEENCGDLKVRVGRLEGSPLLTFTSAWQPDESELARIIAGAPIELTVVGSSHPVVAIAAGPVPKPKLVNGR